MGHYDSDISFSEKEINRLRSRIHETYECRLKNDHKLKEWKASCDEFHHKFETLAFPGGFGGAYERILSGDPKAIEAALCFIELRPYFFRSGYMYKDILRKLNKAPLKPDDQSRYEIVKSAYLEYRSKKPNKGRHAD